MTSMNPGRGGLGFPNLPMGGGSGRLLGRGGSPGGGGGSED